MPGIAIAGTKIKGMAIGGVKVKGIAYGGNVIFRAGLPEGTVLDSMNWDPITQGYHSETLNAPLSSLANGIVLNYTLYEMPAFNSVLSYQTVKIPISSLLSTPYTFTMNAPNNTTVTMQGNMASEKPTLNDKIIYFNNINSSGQLYMIDVKKITAY